MIKAIPIELSTLIPLLWALPSIAELTSVQISSDQLEFFESKVRPALGTYCYQCHSAQAGTLQGGLRLDVKWGWQTGGDSGEPALVPNKPGESRLIRAIRHEEGESAMPPNQPKLPDQV